METLLSHASYIHFFVRVQLSVRSLSIVHSRSLSLSGHIFQFKCFNAHTKIICTMGTDGTSGSVIRICTPTIFFFSSNYSSSQLNDFFSNTCKTLIIQWIFLHFYINFFSWLSNFNLNFQRKTIKERDIPWLAKPLFRKKNVIQIRSKVISRQNSYLPRIRVRGIKWRFQSRIIWAAHFFDFFTCSLTQEELLISICNSMHHESIIKLMCKWIIRNIVANLGVMCIDCKFYCIQEREIKCNKKTKNTIIRVNEINFYCIKSL